MNNVLAKSIAYSRRNYKRKQNLRRFIFLKWFTHSLDLAQRERNKLLMDSKVFYSHPKIIKQIFFTILDLRSYFHRHQQHAAHSMSMTLQNVIGNDNGHVLHAILLRRKRSRILSSLYRWSFWTKNAFIFFHWAKEYLTFCKSFFLFEMNSANEVSYVTH